MPTKAVKMYAESPRNKSSYTHSSISGRFEKEPIEKRFWLHVRKTRTCWLWTGEIGRHGYGRFYISPKSPRGAHRISWEIANGPIVQKEHVLHRCDTPACVRPDHLFLGSNLDNVKDAVLKRRHPTVKLFARDVRRIRQMLIAGESNAAVARKFGVYATTIWRIAHGKTWAYVK